MNYQTPKFFIVAEGASGRTYRQWLTRRARSLRNHDRDARYHVHPVEYYRKAIDTAMRRSCGVDEYSGLPIDWTLAFADRTAFRGSRRRRAFAAAPSIDHITGGGLVVAICRDDTNGAKGCMTLSTFYDFCTTIASRPRRFLGDGQEADAGQ